MNTIDRDTRIKELRSQGKSYRAIAQIIGCSRELARTICGGTQTPRPVPTEKVPCPNCGYSHCSVNNAQTGRRVCPKCRKTVNPKKRGRKPIQTIDTPNSDRPS